MDKSPNIMKNEEVIKASWESKEIIMTIVNTLVTPSQWEEGSDWGEADAGFWGSISVLFLDLGAAFTRFYLCNRLLNFAYILDWPKSEFGFFCGRLWRNPSELFGQPNILCTFTCISYSMKMYEQGGKEGREGRREGGRKKERRGARQTEQMQMPDPKLP